MAFKNILLFFVLLKFMISQNNRTFYRCGADDNKINPIPVKYVIPKGEKDRRLAGEIFGDFHIYLDLINIKKDIKNLI